MLEQGNIKELEEYVNLLNEKKPKEQPIIDTNHVIVNAILNTKYVEMRDKDILFVMKINDLSGLTIRDDDLVVLLSNAESFFYQPTDRYIVGQNTFSVTKVTIYDENANIYFTEMRFVKVVFIYFIILLF